MPDGGKVLFDGADMTTKPANRRPSNTVFQDLALFPHMNVGQNVAYGLKVLKRPRDEIARRVAEVLSLDADNIALRDPTRPRDQDNGQESGDDGAGGPKGPAPGGR